ncbi:hypothetical protein CKAH01_12371 [Colletotrichum kahawae]|uniref:Uncharacterized protein n=1 Tax=Colletotrichum kahawae TaxID=34407 RepID=A0AAD9YR27_COLKA|nr:hypothetical protein CKAH01_12371 [Colletotrichum kahawae]
MSLFADVCRQMPPMEDVTNPDVSGIGVVVGFVVTGWLLILLLIVYYVFGHDPELDPFRKNNQRGRMAKHPNELDVAFLTGLRINLSYLGLGFSWLQDHQKGGKVETAFNKVRSLRKVLVSYS